MLIEAEEADLLEMLQVPDVLQAKVTDALLVLKEWKGTSA